MSLVTRKLLLICLFIVLVVPGRAQSAAQQEKAEKIILKVLSEYKNPLSYYPLRRDIFLPDEEEMAKIEREQNYPKGAHSFGFIVFVKDDSSYYREPFIDADGDILDLSVYPKIRPLLSLRPDSYLFRRKQQALINRSPSASRIQFFNTNYHLLK